jgi:hypothetical protein
MIDPRELTIGSLVQDELGTILEVTSLSPTIINAKLQGWDGSSGYSPGDLEPIALTAEWLERLGFELMNPYNGVVGRYWLKLPTATIEVNYHTNTGKGVFKSAKANMVLSTVHALQALIQATYHHWLTLTPTTPTP